MNIKHEKDIKLLTILQEVCEKIAAACPDDAHMYVRMANEPYHCDGFPVTAMIGAIVYDHFELFADKPELLAGYLKIIGAMADIRLPLMEKEDNEPESDNCAADGVDSSEDES